MILSPALPPGRDWHVNNEAEAWGYNEPWNPGANQAGPGAEGRLPGGGQGPLPAEGVAALSSEITQGLSCGWGNRGELSNYLVGIRDAPLLLLTRSWAGRGRREFGKGSFLYLPLSSSVFSHFRENITFGSRGLHIPNCRVEKLFNNNS